MCLGEDANMAFVELKNVQKVYKTGEVETKALVGVDFEVEKGELCVVVGPSGAGKSTVLNLLGGMDSPTSGDIVVDGKHIEHLNDKQLTLYRRNDIGFIFQFYNLVQNLTALENVELAAQICHDPIPAAEALEAVGLGHRLDNFPAQLSGGEQQRVSIARALAKQRTAPGQVRPHSGDEPTGALDYNTGKQILSLLQSACREGGMTVIVVTHNTAITPMADRVITIRNSKVASNIYNPHPADIATIEW